MYRLTLVVIAVVAVSLILGAFLVPGDDEMALMKYRDGDVDQARIAYERKLHAGNVTPLDLKNLSNLYLSSGMVEQAADVYARYVDEVGENEETLLHLGSLYLQSSRLADHVSVSESLYELKRDEESLISLANACEMAGDYVRLAQVLELRRETYHLDLDTTLKLVESYVAQPDLIKADEVFQSLSVATALDLPHERLMSFYQVAYALGFRHRMIPVLERLLLEGEEHDSLVNDLLTVYSDEQEITRGLAFFTKLQSKSDDKSIELAWVKLAILSGKESMVEEWLNSQESLAPEDLKPLYFVASKNEMSRVAERMAASLSESSEDPSWKQVQLDWLVKAERFEDSRQLSDQLLADGALNRREYEFYLTQISDESALNLYFQQRSLDISLSDKDRLNYIDVLLERGQKEAAVASLWKLAEGKPSMSAVVKKLMYLWGPIAAKEELDWLVKHVRQSSEPERSTWVQYLVNAGGNHRLVTFLNDRWPITGSAADVALIQLLADQKRWEEASRWIRTASSLDRDADRLEKYAWWAEQSENFELSAAVRKKLLSVDPTRHAHKRWLGDYWWKQGNSRLALGYVQSYLREKPNDYEAALLIADIYQATGNDSEEQRYLGHALRLVSDPRVEASFNVSLLKAQIFERLGQTEKAIVSYRRLLVQRPGDDDVRASYASLLLQAGRLEDSRKVLGL